MSQNWILVDSILMTSHQNKTQQFFLTNSNREYSFNNITNIIIIF